MRIPPGQGVSGNAIARRREGARGARGGGASGGGGGGGGGGRRRRKKNRDLGPVARLVVERLEAGDGGAYKCRTDFEKSPTRNHRVDLQVLSKKK